MSRWTPNCPVNHYIGMRVQERRTALKISRKVLSEKLGISYQQLQKYETGKNTISGAKLYALSTYLDVSVGYFYPSE